MVPNVLAVAPQSVSSTKYMFFINDPSNNKMLKILLPEGVVKAVVTGQLFHSLACTSEPGTGERPQEEGNYLARRAGRAGGHIDACQDCGKNSVACIVLCHSLWQHSKHLPETQRV